MSGSVQITATVPRVAYTAVSPTTDFAVPFPFDDAADLIVTVDGATVTFTIVSGALTTGIYTSATVRLTTAATGRIVIVRQTALEQDAVFPGSGTFRTPVLNREISREWMALQDQRLSVAQALRVPISDDPISTLPAKALRANSLVGFNADGDLTLASGTLPVVSVSPWAATLLDDVDAAGARGTLGLSARWWQDGTSGSPLVGFASFNGGFYRHTATADPVYGGTNTLALALNGTARYRFFESVLSCNLPPGDNFGITDGTRVFHIGNDGLGYYVATSTNHYLRLVTNNGTGPGITIGDESGGGTGFTGRIATTADHPVCFGMADFTGATNGVAIDTPGSANTIIRSTSGAGSRSHIGFYKSGGTLVGTIATTDSATAYNTTSDERLKVMAGPIPSGAILDALDPFMHGWVHFPDAPAVPGLSAQAVHAVAPYAVQVGDADLDAPMARPWSADWSKLIPVLIAEIKSLRARVAALE